MCHNIRTPFERPTVDRCGKGVVDDEGYSVLMGNAGKLLNIQYGTSRVGDGLAE